MSSTQQAFNEARPTSQVVGVGCRPEMQAAALRRYSRTLAPKIPAGVVNPIGSSNIWITPALCLALFDAGWDAILPSEGLTTVTWLKQTLKHYLSPVERNPSILNLAAQSMQLGIHIESNSENQIAYLGFKESNSSVGRIHIGKFLERAERYAPGLGALLATHLGTDSWIMTPAHLFDFASMLYWGGDESEETVVEERRAECDEDDEYNGVRLDDFKKRYPAWAYLPETMANQAKKLTHDQLVDISKKSSFYAEVARELISLIAATPAPPKRHKARPWYMELDDAEFEDSWGYGAFAAWSPDDNLIDWLSDEMYQCAMECGATDNNIMLRLPETLTKSEAKLFISVLTGYVHRFGCLSRLIRIINRTGE